MEQNNLCPVCHYQLQNEWYFCPNCGKSLKGDGNTGKPLSTSIGKQIVIYLVSFFLAPLGLGWGIQYVRSKDSKARIIGIISIVLTIAAVGLLLYAAQSFMSYYGKLLNSYTNPNGGY